MFLGRSNSLHTRKVDCTYFCKTDRSKPIPSSLANQPPFSFSLNAATFDSLHTMKFIDMLIMIFWFCTRAAFVPNLPFTRQFKMLSLQLIPIPSRFVHLVSTTLWLSLLKASIKFIQVSTSAITLASFCVFCVLPKTQQMCYW